MVLGSLSFFNSYDIFGKSIPGAVLIVGIYFLLPVKIPFINPVNTQFDLLVQILTVGIVGLLIGEAIHSLAVIVERVMKQIGRYTLQFIQRVESVVSSALAYTERRQIESLIRAELDSTQDGDAGSSDTGGDNYNQINTETQNRAAATDKTESDDGKSATEGPNQLMSELLGKLLPQQSISHETKSSLWYIASLPFRAILLVAIPGKFLVDILYPALQPHRVIFDMWVLENYGGEGRAVTWNLTTDELLREQFADACEDIYGFDIYKLEPSDELYTIVAATVSQNGTGLSQRFQDLYTFCRSMWVVLLTIFLWVVLMYTGVLSYSPWWMSVLTEHPIYSSKLSIRVSITAATGGLVIVATLFLYASSRYKQIYIKYLISDIVSIHNSGSQVKPEN